MTTALKGLSVFLFALWPMMAVISIMGLGGPGATNDKSNLRGIILFLYYPVIISSIYWLADAALFGVGGKYLLAISVIIVTLGIRKLGYFKLAANVMRGINNEGYSVVGDKVYYDAKHIPTADAETFRPAEKADYSFRQAAYYLDKHRVYCEGVAIPGVDPASFRRLNVEGGYGRRDYWGDNTVVLYDGKVLPDADPKDIEALADNYVRSNNNVYHFANKINNVDAKTFEVITSFLAKDKLHVYYADSIILPEADASTFRLLNPAESDSIAVDMHNVYFIFTESGSRLLEGIDVESVEVLDGGAYIKDTIAVYQIRGRDVSPVPEANPAKFRTMRYSEETPYHATDDVRYWLNGELIQ